jgi:DNA replication protein DnaC
MNEFDLEYLKKFKQEVVDKCEICHGKNLNCECYKKYSIEQAKIFAKIPIAYRDTNLDNLRSQKIKPAIKQVNEYINNFNDYLNKGIGIFFYGPNGSAKTYLACHILTHAIISGYSGLFLPLFEIIDKFVADKQKILIAIEKTNILVLDDIGFIYRSPTSDIAFIDSLLDRIIKTRTNLNLPIILTSDKSPKELMEEKIGNRLVSALNKKTLLVKCEGQGGIIWR